MPLSSISKPTLAVSGPSGADDSALLAEIIETQADLAAVELEPQLIMRMAADRVQRLTHAEGAVVELLEDNWLVCKSGSGIMQCYEGKKLPLEGSLAGLAVRTKTFQYSPNADGDARVDQSAVQTLGFQSIVAVPLFNGPQPIGALVVLSSRANAFDERLITALRLMAGLIVASLSHASELEIKKKLLTDRTEALSALGESVQRFQSAFEHAAIGMALVALDGRWLRVNRSLSRIVGYTESELLVRDFQSITYPADLDLDLVLVRRLIAGEIPDYQMVKRYIHRQGHVVWALLCVSLVRDESGKPLYFIAQIQDITERQHAEEALRASEEEYRATFELASVGTVQTDLATGRFLRVNKKMCQITGYSAEELRCMSFGQITHPDDLAMSRQLAGRMLAGEISEHAAEKRYVRKTGETIWVNISISVLRDQLGRPSRAVATFLDITERKHAEWLEQDRRRVLEMVARDHPFKDVLNCLTETLERQVEGSLAAVMVLNDGEIRLHSKTLPTEMQTGLRTNALRVAAGLSNAYWLSKESCGVTCIADDVVWNDLRDEAASLGIKTCWSTVVQAVDGTTLGLLLLFTRQSQLPSKASAQTLDMVSKLATICIEHHHTNVQLSHLVRHDPLTGLPNRLMCHDRMQQALAVAARSRNHVGVLVLDIDRFKTINDTLGHHAGDQLLQQFSHRLRSQLREADTMARMGGDEFVIVLPELTGEDAATTVAQKLVESLKEPFVLADQDLRATCSIGVAIYPRDGEDAIALQKKADAALYRVKENGRNGFSL